MINFKKKAIKFLSLLCVATMGAGFAVQSLALEEEAGLPASAQTNFKKVDARFHNDLSQFYDKNVVYKLPETVADDEEISVIVKLNADSLIDSFKKQKTCDTVAEYVDTRDARILAARIENQQKDWFNRLRSSGIAYEIGEKYDTLLNGFEIVIKASEFEKANKFFGEKATLIVGDEYAPAQTVPIHNDVEVYDTGIFDSSTSEYQGDGVVVAVLDTGLDYTHTAFLVENFSTTQEAFTLSSVSSKISKTAASRFTKGLTGQDVYMNKKVPFAYDYADKDPDVLPINSDHGTHVAGIIAGNDDVITGVAPNAQLAIMKVFSDEQQGAKDSWILSALEDCVTLGVDVINMSLGSNAGFTREVDKKNTNAIYDSIHEAGISLITAAGNDYNATHGSTKNGSNGLTSNPDSGPVGAPSTYQASLSVASVDGVKTPYLRYKDDIIYFKEASTSDAETRDFVDDILKMVGNVDSYDFEYATIPGVGRSADYPEDKSFYQGKIVLVKRGQTTFEDKVRVALMEKGAAGIIIYNNVSGDISMSIGDSVGAVCSISQDEGEKLAAAGSGIIKISRAQTAGPFMSDFSSWGPTSDLKIKPEITAHGGEILSAVPGQSYDRLSGTSMACPNQAGAAALIRQYVKYSQVFGTKEEMEADPVGVTKLVNQLMMSTTDIVLNKNGLPYSIRKQGSGLVNIKKAYTSASYISTFEQVKNELGEMESVEMDKTKLELGDDKNRTGVYEFSFAINNVSANQVTYDLSPLILTEGVSTTYTSHGDTTVTQEGYLLNGTKMEVLSVDGGSKEGTKVSVGANGSAMVTMRLTLSEADKKYLEDSFEYGMYVEGFIKMKGVSGTTVDMSVPLLAFYGDWTEAPIFDEEYYDTHKDEINAGLDDEDKLMADAYATRVIGGLYSDYIATLGTYYFTQNPNMTQISASKEKIALSNQEMGENSSLNSISAIWAGLLRNVKYWNMKIVEDSTGEVIFTKDGYNQRKSTSSGSTIYQSTMDIDFSVLEHNLKNNTKYTVTVESFIDYGDYEAQNNARNVFEFPLYIDFEAPVITNVAYRTEYDKMSKKTKLFADISVYDNHYAMGLQLGQIIPETDPETSYVFSMASFGKYITPVYSTYNSTSMVTVELTDYVSQIKNSCGLDYNTPNTGSEIVYNNNSFIINCYDYAMNGATYEVRLPDEILSMYFTEEEALKLSPNETKDLTTILEVFPAESWLQVLDFETSDKEIVDIVNQTVIAKQSGEAVITAIGYDKEGKKVTATLNVKVLSPEDEGYQGGYTIPDINKFTVTGYKVNKAYYSVNSEEREIGLTGGTQAFGNSLSLSMFPSESVTVEYLLDSYFPDRTAVKYSSGKDKVASVDEKGTIVAKEEGTTTISVSLTFDGKPTFYSAKIVVNVKDPYTTNAIYLMSYKGNGGVVEIPADRGITTIYAYAFSNYEYVEKDLAAGDVINDEDPYHLKQMYLGEDTITKIVIPEGVTHINEYAFAKLTALEEVVLPSTLINIGVGAFYGCEKLSKINLENVKFINASAFENTALHEIKLDKINAIGNYAFRNCKLTYVELPESSQSLGIGTFANNEQLRSVTFKAKKIKLGSSAFAGCKNLRRIDINTAVISSYAFQGSGLEEVRLGADVAVIGEYAFAGAKVKKFSFITTNSHYSLKKDGALLYDATGTKLVLAAPDYKGEYVNNETNVVVLDDETTTIGAGAFSGNGKIFQIVANNVTTVETYAFTDCSALEKATLNKVETIGDYAFAGTALKATPNLEKTKTIGKFAFALSKLEGVTLPSEVVVDEYAFAYNPTIKNAVIGNGVTLGEGAFYCPVEELTYEKTGSLERYNPYSYDVLDEEGNVVKTYSYYRYDYTAGAYSSLTNIQMGTDVTIGDYAFYGNVTLKTLTLGENAVIGAYAFYNAAGLTNVDLANTKEVGAYAFSGSFTQDYWLNDNVWQYAYDLVMLNGQLTAIDYMYSSFAPAFAEVNLTSVTALGEGAFANNGALNSVIIGASVSAMEYNEDGVLNVIANKIPSGAFAECTVLTTMVLPETVTDIGAYAFYRSSLTSVNLNNVKVVGAYAFANTELQEVVLAENATIDEAAFAYCYDLATIENLNKVTEIGANAFVASALTEVDLSAATYVGDFAFSMTALNKVVLGENLKKLGENPFYATEITTYGKEEDLEFNGQVVGVTLNENYNVSDTVMVIDGVLYQVLANGKLGLVSYPTAREQASYTVVEGTTRISARAFASSKLTNATLPSTLLAIGDKAFYGCSGLSTVIFTSYEAPILEEEYDMTHLTYQNLPNTGYLANYEGLGIVPYYMWNVTSLFNNFYFGANFVDFIGHVTNKLVMVKPANGVRYDTFIFTQYFGKVVEGNHAATKVTLEVMAMIAALPDAQNVTLADKEVIESARRAFENLPSDAQKSLVDTTRLKQAEMTLDGLSNNLPTPEPPQDSSIEQTGCFGGVNYGMAWILMLAVGFLFLRKQQTKETEDKTVYE